MRFTLSFLTIILFYSCTNHNLAGDIEQLKQQQITLSSDLNSIYNGKDTVLTDFLEAPIKLVIWYDAMGCLSCEASKMNEWEAIVADAAPFSQWFSIVFLFTPPKEDWYKLSMSLKSGKFNYPVFIDRTASFIKQNSKLPKNRKLHSFLLDKNNRVVMVGNPLHNPVLWDLYKSTIQKMINNDGILPES